MGGKKSKHEGCDHRKLRLETVGCKECYNAFLEELDSAPEQAEEA